MSSTLLHIEVSPRGARSLSRQLGREYVAAVTAARPATRVVAVDVGHNPPPTVTESWVEGAFAPPDQQSAEAKAAISVSDAYVADLVAADEIVIATPIYNFGMPAALKAWIDQIVRIGRTVAYGEGGFSGLVTGKRVVVLVSSGSDFRPGSAFYPYNFLESHLKGVLGFIGITDVEFIYAPNATQGDEAKAAGIAGARAKIDARVARGPQPVAA